MSRISQDFINDLGFLYEHIHVKDQDFLNEESEYYEEETAELTEDIVLSLALTMFSEGYTAETFLKFLSSSDEEVILEKYLNINVSYISEEAIYNDFVEEQFELLEAAGLIKLLGRGLKAIGAGAKATRSAVKKGVTKAAEVGVERRVSKQLLRRKGVDIAVPGSKTGRSGSSWDRTTAALERLSKSKAKKAGIDVPSGKLDPRQSTELLKQARTAKAIQGVKTAAKGALIGGTGVLAGYTGAKLGSGGSGQQDGGKQTPSGAGGAVGDAAGTDGTGGGGTGAPARPSSTTDSRNTQYQKDRAAISTAKTPEEKAAAIKKAEETGMAAWARAHPELAARVKPGQSGYDVISRLRDKPSDYEKQDQTPTQGSPTAQIDTKAVEDALKAEQERQKKRIEQQNKTPVTAKESYEPYDIVLNYLLSEGHADTLEEANYIMLEMDENAICTIIEDYNDYLLAEEIEEWVNDLVNEGYDLSDYSWDDMVEYYVTEANRGDEHVTSSMYMSREPETKAAKVRRRQKRDGLPDNPSHQGDDKDYDRQFAHRVERGRKKLKPHSSETLEGDNKNKNTATGKYAAMQRRKRQGLSY